MKAWPSKKLNPSGKRSMIFTYIPKLIYEPDPDGYTELKCGQCIGCKLARSCTWAIRCMHQAQMHEQNTFITFTLNNQTLLSRKNSKNNPKHKKYDPAIIYQNQQSIDVEEHQLFLKRLRKKYKQKIKYFHCGEYGDINRRPHYHSIIFNFDFPDKQYIKENHQGDLLYVSEILEGTKQFKHNYLEKYHNGKYNPNYSPQLGLNKKPQKGLWPHGLCIIGDVTFQSAAYVARYIVKKINGKKADEINDQGLKHYEHYDPIDGVITKLIPEYTTMSNGIGESWFKQFHFDVYPSDTVVINGKKNRPPRYYDILLEELNLEQYELTKEKRLNNLDPNDPDLTPARLKDRETILKLKTKALMRNHDKQER